MCESVSHNGRIMAANDLEHLLTCLYLILPADLPEILLGGVNDKSHQTVHSENCGHLHSQIPTSLEYSRTPALV